MNESSYFRRLARGLELACQNLGILGPDVRRTSGRMALVGALALGMGVAACSSDEELPRIPGGDGGSVDTEPCEPGTERACGVTLDQDHGIISCYRGTQICDDDGGWGKCQGGSISQEPDPTARDANGGLRFKSLSLSLPISCFSNDVCKSTDSWSDTATYSLGDQIKHDVGSLHASTGLGGAGSDIGEDYYECIDAANCSGDPALYEPGVGTDWEEAWERVGSCLDLCDPNCNYFFEDPPDGGGSMPPPEFPGTPDSTLCEHDLCTPGAALSPSMPCDSCVTSVCSVRPTCCTTTWDATCADLTYSECVHSPPPLGLCDFGLYAETSITTANRPVSGSAIGANGNVTIGTDMTGTLPIVAVNGNLQINSPNGKAVSIPGGVWVSGNITFQSGGGAVWTGDFTSGGTIDTSGGNRINGEAWATGSITGQSGAGINQGAYAGGTISTNINTPTPSPKVPGSTHAAPIVNIPTVIPTRTATCPGTTNITLTGGQSYPTAATTIAPGNYGAVNMSNGNNYVRLGAPGAYTFTSISASGGNSGTRNVILLSEPAGNYDITVCGAVSVGNWFDTRTCTTSNCANASSVQLTTATRFLMYADTTVTAGTDSYFGGVTWVPNGAFTSGDRTRVNGPLWAAQVNAGTDLNATQLSETDCTALGIPGTAPVPGACPIDNIDPGSPPQTVEPCETGADCQVNQRCTEVNTDTCSHSKCAPGVALADGCDRCVSMICDVDATCCNSATGAWTWDCVDQVATVCDAYCGDFASDICQHSICSTGIAIDDGCSACTTTVCSNAAYAYCCDSTTGPGWNQACVDRAYAVCGSGSPTTPARGATVCDYSVAGGYNVQSNGARMWGGDVGGGTGANTLQAESGNSQVCMVAATDSACTSPANLYSQGTVFLSTAVETGEVYARGSYFRSGGTTPSREPAASGDPLSTTIPSASVAARTFTCGTGTTSVGTATWSAGTYGNVTVTGWGSTLTLNAGTYYFASLTIDSGAILRVPTGNVVINICGNYTMNQNASVSGLTTGTDLFRLQIYAKGTITLNHNTTMYGILMGGTAGAPGTGSTVTYTGPVTHYGAVWTNGRVFLDADWGARATIDRTSFTSAQCLAAGLDPANLPVSCPETYPGVPDPTETGSCVDNDGLAAEDLCSTFDLAADYPCEDAVPICNHGSGAFSGNVTVGYWNITSNQFAVSTPSTTGMSTCSASLNIAAGACVDLPCVMPAGNDYTIMVDPNDALAECNNHRSDNWSWKQDGSSCGSGGPSLDAEYDYLSDCPEGTSAQWKYLTWVTDVPSGSVEWAAKVGNDDAELDAASYTVIGTSDAVNEVCALTGAVPGPSTACPVPITDELSLAANQGQMLRLQITPSGSAVVQDWAVSYTCAYDE